MEKEKVDHYDVNEVIDRFNIEKIFNSTVLNHWVSIPALSLKPAYQEVLEEARQNLLTKWDEWNEEELKINFTRQILALYGTARHRLQCKSVLRCHLWNTSYSNCFYFK
jgi:hypothetical protein